MIIDIIEILIVFYLISLTIGFLLTQGGSNATRDPVRPEDEKV